MMHRAWPGATFGGMQAVGRWAGREPGIIVDAGLGIAARLTQLQIDTLIVDRLPRIGDNVQRKGLEGAPPNLADPPPGCRFHPRCPLAMEICSRRVPDMIESAPGHRVACFAVNGSGEP